MTGRLSGGTSGGSVGGRSGGAPRVVRWFGADLLADLFENALEPGYAAAAERRRKRGPGPVWRRRAGRVCTALVLLVFGVLVATAYRQSVAQRPHTSRTHDKLVSDVKARQAETDALQHREDELRGSVARERDRALGAGPLSADRLRDLEAGAGLAGVSGPGMTVRVSDAPTPKDPVTGRATSENLGRVLDLDLQYVVNGLWQAGAEAVAVDGQRLAATSTIRTAGEAILVDFRPVTNPYTVTAIGPPSMRSRFSSSAVADRYRGFARRYHMGFSVSDSSSLRLAAAAEPELRYARPVGGASSAGPSGAPSRTGGGR